MPKHRAGHWATREKGRGRARKPPRFELLDRATRMRSCSSWPLSDRDSSPWPIACSTTPETWLTCCRTSTWPPTAGCRSIAATGHDEDQAARDHAGPVSERLDLATALAELPVEQRALVLMVDRDGFDYRTAADALSIPLGTVSSRLAAARARLRRALSSEEASDET